MGDNWNQEPNAAIIWRLCANLRVQFKYISISCHVVLPWGHVTMTQWPRASCCFKGRQGSSTEEKVPPSPDLCAGSVTGRSLPHDTSEWLWLVSTSEVDESCQLRSVDNIVCLLCELVCGTVAWPLSSGAQLKLSCPVTCLTRAVTS